MEKTNEIWLDELEQIRDGNLYRVMPSISGRPGKFIYVNGKLVLNFSSNNYLGLAGHPEVIRASMDTAREFGAGATASRLIAGNSPIHRELENFIARWKGTEAALVFGSGYQANLGVLTALAQPQDLIISDRLNHASIIDGSRLSRAKVMVYRHLDLNNLEEILRTEGFRRKLVVTESIFSMDGDQAPLKEIGYLCRKHGAVLMVDEAHATGIYGPQGQGLAAELGTEPEVQMGTLGKAAGTSGAYVAGSRNLMELLTNRARSLIYTTASPPSTAGSALAALKIISSEEGVERRTALKRNTKIFHRLLGSLLAGQAEPSHIVPVRIGDSDRTMRISAACTENGIFAHGIRFPTVPEGTARLRFTLMSDHDEDDLTKAVAVLTQVIENIPERK